MMQMTLLLLLVVVALLPGSHLAVATSSSSVSMLFLSSSSLSSSSLLLFLFLGFLPQDSHAELKPRCGDCWCIVDDAGNDDGVVGECPTDEEGISDTFPADQYQIYETFELTNPDAPYLSLHSADGGDCYPFADTLSPIDGFAGSSLPQCVLYNSNTSETAVCAFLYEPDTECQNRRYQILTYESEDDAQLAGAVVTHAGGCGVCSSAYDLWGRMASIDDFATDTLICGVSYLLNQDKEARFDQLANCAVKAGLGPECALLWAHYGATLVSKCASECNAGTSADTNGPAPQCELTDCPACPSAWDANFLNLGGRTMYNSGMSDGTARKCSSFARMDLEPCVGATTGAELSPTAAPAPNKSGSTTGSRFLFGNGLWVLEVLAVTFAAWCAFL